MGSRRPLRIRLARFAFAAGSLVAVAALLALTVLRLWAPDTALMLVLGGVALALLTLPDAPAWSRAVGKGCAAGTVLLASLTLMGYVLGPGSTIERWLGPAGGLPNLSGRRRPSPHAATGLMLAGVALLFLAQPAVRYARAAQILALGVISIPIVALLGYAFELPALYSLPARAPASIAPHTALALALLAAGILVARPDVGVVAVITSEHAGGVMARRFLLGPIFFLPLAILVIVGKRLGWYAEPAVAELLVLLALAEGLALIVLTGIRFDRDDVARKSAEARLQQSEARFRELYEEASDGIFLADLDGRYLDVNGAGCRLLRLSREQIVGRRVREFVVKEEHERLMAARQQMLDGGSMVAEWTMVRGDGSLAMVEVTAKLLAERRWQALIRDITDRKRLEFETAQRHASEAAQRTWLQNIVEQMPEGVVLLNERGRMVAVNRAALALARPDAGERDRWGNARIFDICASDGSPIPFDDLPVARALARGELTTGEEMAARQADGRLVAVQIKAAPVRDRVGRVTGAAVIIRDVSALKDQERLREEWISIVAHDLRQPASAISLTVESLSRLPAEKVPEKERRAIKRMRSASTRLNRMIEDLLDASRIEAKRLSVERSEVDVPALIDAVVEGQREAASAYNIVVHADRDQLAWVDPDRIHQVLSNLISNAAKYGTPGTEIRIDCANRGDFVEVIVTNHGPGIPPEQLPRLFTRFGRLQEPVAEGAQGLGLGLYISKGLVEAHGGGMWAESVPGLSTSFHFTLPKDVRSVVRGPDLRPPAELG